MQIEFGIFIKDISIHSSKKFVVLCLYIYIYIDLCKIPWECDLNDENVIVTSIFRNLFSVWILNYFGSKLAKQFYDSKKSNSAHFNFLKYISYAIYLTLSILNIIPIRHNKIEKLN